MRTPTAEKLSDIDNAAERLQAKEISPFIGSVIGLDKKTLLSGKYSLELRELIEQRGVLVFPKFNPTDDEQVAFTKSLGGFAQELRGEEVFKITLDKGANSSAEYLKGSLFWHVDGTMHQKPIWISVLSSKVLSPTGGETEFCNTCAAWEQLPEEEQKKLEALKVMHSAWNTLFYYDPEPSYAKLKELMGLGKGDSVLPLVWRHRSGRKSLLLGCTAHHVIGMDPKQSIELLVRLRDWATQPKFVYSHKWSLGDMVMWDNTATMHRARPYPPDCGRMLHRTLLRGEEALI
jgi:alpha-ketoglutarate-dependent taurine dioxygenase